MKKVFRWMAGGIIVLILLIVAGYFIMRSRRFHNYVLATIVHTAEQSTGGRVEVGSYAIHLRGLHVDLYDVVLHGTESNPQKPLLSVDRVDVALKVVSSLRVRIRSIVIDHPVIRLAVDRQGHNNIPHARKKSARTVNVFHLAIPYVAVNRGELEYNNNKSQLEAALHDLLLRLDFNSSSTSYNGSLSYRQGVIRIRHYMPLEHNLQARFSAQPAGLTIQSLVLSTPHSHISFHGTLTDYANPTVQGSYNAALSPQDLRSVMNPAALPAGQFVTTGSVRYHKVKKAPLIDTLFVDGQLSSLSLAVHTGQARANLRSFQAHYRLEDGNLAVDGIQADALGGRIMAAIAMRDLAATPLGTLRASARDVSLDAASRMIGTNPLRGVPLHGNLSGEIEATWHGGMEGLVARSDLFVRSRAATRPASGERGSIPVDADLHLTYNGYRKTISITKSYIRTPHTSVRLNGTASERTSLAVQARSDDLREADQLLLVFRKAFASKSKPAQPPRLFEIGGSASLSGRLQGRMDAPHFMGQATVKHLRYRGESVPLIRTNIDLSPSRVALDSGLLQLNPKARVRFDVSAGLRHWSYANTEPITVRISTRQFPVPDLEHLANRKYPLSGALTANIAVHGSQLHPSGQGSIQLTQAQIAGQPVQSVSATFQGNGNAVHATIAVRAPAGNASGNLVYDPQNQGYQITLDSPGIHIDQLAPIRSHNLKISGVLSLAASGNGTIKAPQLNLTARMPQLQVEGKTISGLNAAVNIAGQSAIVRITSAVGASFFEANAHISLEPGYYTTAKLDTRSLPLGPLLAHFAPQYGSGFRGQTEIHASLAGPLQEPERLQADVAMPTLTLGYEKLHLAAVTPIRLVYGDGIVTLQHSEFKGTDTDVQVQGMIPLRGAGSFDAHVLGTVDMAIVKLFNPQINSSGQLLLNVNAQGTRAHPSIRGRIRIVNTAIQYPGAPLGIEQLNGEMALENGYLNITRLSGQTGGGTITATGSLVYFPKVQFNLQLAAQHVRLRYPQGVRTVFRSNLVFNGDLQTASLTGQALIDRVSFTPDFDLSTFMARFTRESAPRPNPGFAQNVRLQIGIQSAENVQLASSKLSLQGAANLRVTGTVADPVLLGRLTLTSGEIFFMSNRYEIQRGVIDFANPVRTEPVVNLAVNTTVDQYNLMLTIVGPVDRMRIAYSSDPPLPPVDIIHLLAFGQTTEAPTSVMTTQMGAESVLAKGISSELSSRVGKLAGLSHLSIDPLLGGNQQNPGARLAIQQRVTKNLLFTFATDVTSTQNEIVRLQYQLTKGWSVSVIRDQNGGYAFDATRHRTF